MLSVDSVTKKRSKINYMNKKLIVAVGLIALGLGAISTVALQSRAQTTPAQPTVVSSKENTVADTDNIQNDPQGIESSDATGTVRSGDGQEQNESSATNVNEVEDGN
jgi:hypothetical protein